jgi:hypothetical protein
MLGELFKRLRSRKDRRREPREDVSLGTINLGGRVFPVRNWSSTGFLASPCEGAFREGDTVDIRFEIQVPGQVIRFSCQAILVRVDAKAQEIAGVFTMMDRDARVQVARHFQ